MNLTKQQIRKNVYEFRRNLSSEDYHKKSSIIYNKIINSQWYLEADTIISYVSTNKEPDTFALINKSGILFNWVKRIEPDSKTEKIPTITFLRRGEVTETKCIRYTVIAPTI